MLFYVKERKRNTLLTDTLQLCVHSLPCPATYTWVTPIFNVSNRSLENYIHMLTIHYVYVCMPVTCTPQANRSGPFNSCLKCHFYNLCWYSRKKTLILGMKIYMIKAQAPLLNANQQGLSSTSVSNIFSQILKCQYPSRWTLKEEELGTQWTMYTTRSSKFSIGVTGRPSSSSNSKNKATCTIWSPWELGRD